MVAVGLLLSLVSLAQIPSGYYNAASGLTGDNLKAALHTIIDGHTEYPYTSTNTDVWDILKDADRDPNNANNVIGIYSGFSMDAAAEYASGAGWNREHVWAKSRGNFGTTLGAGTDCHHLRAADVSTNSARNNRNFDEATTQYIDGSGNYSGTTDSYTSSTDWIWEPRDEVKGDVARMIFYMVVRYEGTNGEPDLELTDNLLTSTDQSPLHGKASVLMAWHLADPVSAAEQARNEVIYGYQGNRNPFIDHPEYACEIFSAYCDSTSNGGGNNGGGDTTTTASADLFLSEYIEGSSYNKALEIANTTGASVDLSSYSLMKETNGGGTWGSEYVLSGSLADGDVFVIAHSSADAAITNVADVATTSGIVTFNGNDVIGLFKDGTLIDVIGDFGSSATFGQDVTKVRNSAVTGPNATYTTSEWDDYATDVFDYIGAHNGSGGSGGSGGTGTTTPTELIISEYMEGSSNNKALEIANITGSSIDLSDYSLMKQVNGAGSWGSEYVLSGTLASGDVWVIANSSAAKKIRNRADVTTGSGIVTFNGNDPIGLFKNGVLIDIVGTFDGGSSNFAQDVTLVRNADVTNPTTTYDSSEWTDIGTNTQTNLGSHTTTSKMSGSVEVESLEVYPIPTSDMLYLPEGAEGSVRIVNTNGQVVMEQTIHAHSVDVTELNTGVYVLLYNSGNKLTSTRIVVE